MCWETFIGPILFSFAELFAYLVDGYRIAAISFVVELVKSFDSHGFSKVLTTSATKLATKFDEEPKRGKLVYC